MTDDREDVSGPEPEQRQPAGAGYDQDAVSGDTGVYRPDDETGDDATTEEPPD